MYNLLNEQTIDTTENAYCIRHFFDRKNA